MILKLGRQYFQKDIIRNTFPSRNFPKATKARTVTETSRLHSKTRKLVRHISQGTFHRLADAGTDSLELSHQPT